MVFTHLTNARVSFFEDRSFLGPLYTIPFSYENSAETFLYENGLV